MYTGSRSGLAPEMRGILLLLTSAVAFSTAGFFTREAPVAPWAMIAWRNLFGCAGLFVMLVASALRGSPKPWHPDRRTGAAITCSALGTIFYLTAFRYTSVANVSIIYAAAPMITAVLAWLSLRERMSRRTFVAACLALAGVVITMGGSLSTGTIAGDGLALLMTIALSAVAVLARGGRLAPVPTALASSLLASGIAAPLSLLDGSSLLVQSHDIGWLAAFGIVTMTLALPCYLAGAVRVPAGKAMLISSIEMPLAPLWVWLAFGEVPSPASLLGGGVIFAAILSDLRSPTSS